MRISRGASLALAAACLAAVIVRTGLNARIIVHVVYLFFPLAIIWFPEELGSYTGRLGGGNSIDETSPPIFLAVVGWVLLLVRVGFVILLIAGKQG